MKRNHTMNLDNYEIYPTSIYQNWHPTWFIPGARCKSHACLWTGETRSFLLLESGLDKETLLFRLNKYIDLLKSHES